MQKYKIDAVGTCFAQVLVFLILCVQLCWMCMFHRSGPASLILFVCSSAGCACFTGVDKTQWRISLTLSRWIDLEMAKNKGLDNDDSAARCMGWRCLPWVRCQNHKDIIPTMLTGSGNRNGTGSGWDTLPKESPLTGAKNFLITLMYCPCISSVSVMY